MSHSYNKNARVAAHQNAINTLVLFAGHGFDTEEAVRNLFQDNDNMQDKTDQVLTKAA